MMKDSIIHQYHDYDRYHCRHKKGFRIPYRHIGRKAVASIVHSRTYVFEHSISKHISSQCTRQRDQHRKGHIVSDQLVSCITGSSESTDHTRFLCNRIASRNTKDKCHDRNNNIKKHDHHRLVSAHVIPGKNNRLVLVPRDKIFQSDNLPHLFHKIL